jgi:DNA-binding GntR family transcriptional regulator
LLKLRKADALYHALKRRIILSELAPGLALAEQHIAAEFGCSQGTVREALMGLQQDGLVARRGYRGTVVSTTSLAEVTQMLNIRFQIESAGVGCTAGRLDPDHHARLQRTVDEMDAASSAGDAYACSELDREFHAQLLRASGMDSLEPILRRCALHMHRYTVKDVAEFFSDSDISITHHRLLKTIAHGTVDEATRAVRKHVLDVLRQWSPTLLAALGEDQDAA